MSTKSEPATASRLIQGDASNQSDSENEVFRVDVKEGEPLLKKLLALKSPLLQRLISASKGTPVACLLPNIPDVEKLIETVEAWRNLTGTNRTLATGARKKKKSKNALDSFRIALASDASQATLVELFSKIASLHLFVGVAVHFDGNEFRETVEGILKQANQWASSESALEGSSPNELAIDDDEPLEAEKWQASALHNQLLNSEWPLTVAAVLHDLGFNKEAKELAQLGTHCMERSASQLLDGDGLAKSAVATQFGPLTASWARCWAFIKHWQLEFDDSCVSQLEWCVRQLLRLLRPDGTILGGPLDCQPVTRGFSQLLLAMSKDRLDTRIARHLLPFNKATSKKELNSVPEESSCSEWGLVAYLQNQWKRRASKVAVHFGQQKCWIEVCRRISLFYGDCTPEISVNGKLLRPVSDFDVVCWHSDEDADVLELEMELDDGVTLQRQIVLGRDDEFLLIGDAIGLNQSESRRIDYRCSFPVASGISLVSESETNELYLHSDKICGLVLPISLPEWKSNRENGQIQIAEQGFSMDQSAVGENMWAGILVDLKPRRSLRPRTWQPLTVAESMKIVKPDVAVAYRVRIGQDQWVVYRSLGEKGNRTFIGENILEDFYIGRFERDGTMEALVKIE